MPISNYPNGFANGVNIRGVPVLNTYGGKVFWVDSVGGSDGNKGTFDRPLATLNKAVSFCTASKGDLVLLMPGHAENVVTALTQVIDKAGVRVVGIGEGELRPVFTFTTTASSFEIDAANVIVENVKFLTSVSAVVVGVNVDADGVVLRGCQWDWDATGDDFLIHVDADAVDHVVIEGCEIIAEDTAGAATGIRIDDCQHLRIVGNTFFGDFSAAAINNDSDAALCGDLVLANNDIYNSDTAATTNGIDLHNACTGVIKYNRVSALNTDAAEYVNAIDPGSCLCYENYASDAINVNATAVPSTGAST